MKLRRKISKHLYGGVRTKVKEVAPSTELDVTATPAVETMKIRQNQVELHNEKAILQALKDEAKSVMILHPTGGYRRVNLERIRYMGNTREMWATISHTLHKACTVPTEVK